MSIRRLFLPLAAALAVSIPAVAQQQTAVHDMTVQGLKQQGWTVVSSTSRNETRPGIAPYEQLQRIVSVTRYELRRGDDTVVCEIAYDSQRDSLEETCEPGS